MAYSVNAPMVVTPVATFAALPAADRLPLLDVLRNANGMYQSHAPALLSAIYTCEQAISGAVRSAVFWMPILPSADGLDYDFSHWIYADAGGAGALTITVDQWTGAAWGNIHASGAVAAPAATWVRHDHTSAISATATILRVTISRAVNAFSPCAILVRPGTNAPAAPPLPPGTLPSGFVPFDDGLLAVGAGDAGINTEHLNRGPQNAMSILRDRRQCVWSFVQEYDTVYALYHTATSPYSDGISVVFGEAVGVIPFAIAPTVTVLAIGVVDAGGTADLLSVYQPSLQGVIMDADGTVQSASLALAMEAPGGLGAHFRLACDGASTVGNNMHVAAVVVLWRPGD